MGFSYDNTLATPLDQVRFEMGDTTNSAADPAMLQDEEILALLVRYDQNAWLTAARLCDRLATTFARQGTLRMGDLMVSGMEQARYYQTLARRFRRSGGAAPKRQDACPDVGRIADAGAGDAHWAESENRPWTMH